MDTMQGTSKEAPDIVVPPELFLLGCVFCVVEVNQYLEEELPLWRRVIEKHGGEIESQYCSRVTHVMCETQRHGVVMQALRDCKRCVTIAWLNDVLLKKQVLPPWIALHLPSIFLDIAPAARHLMAVDGFGRDLWKVKDMVKIVGSKCTTYLTKHNTILISGTGEGDFFEYAKKWQIPIVNIQWLTDIMLGHYAMMNQTDHQMYQQFPNPPNFSFDPKLVPNLMVAWKSPINISQESYERVKNLPVVPKKVQNPEDKVDESENEEQYEITNPSYKIVFSSYSYSKHLEKMVRKLGGCLAKDYEDFTHLVVPRLNRTVKLLLAITKNAKIVPGDWLKASNEANQFLPEKDFRLDPTEFNELYNCDYEQSLLAPNKEKILAGKTFHVTPSCGPTLKEMQDLITSCGGVVEEQRRTWAQIEPGLVANPESYFVVMHEEDVHLVVDLLKYGRAKWKIVCCVELIYSAITKQRFELEPHAVSVTEESS